MEREGIDLDLDFDESIDLDPYTLFRRLKEGRPPLLLALSPTDPALSAAQPWSPESPLPEAREIVLVDQDGTIARPLARRLQAEGHRHVRALFGGITLYDYCLDPRVVGDERFLREPDEPGD